MDHHKEESCLGKRLHAKHEGDSLALLAAMAACYIGLVLLEEARVSQTEGDKARSRRFLGLSGIALGGQVVWLLSFSSTADLLDCEDHHVNVRYEIRLAVGSAIVAVVGVASALYLGLASVTYKEDHLSSKSESLDDQSLSDREFLPRDAFGRMRRYVARTLRTAFKAKEFQFKAKEFWGGAACMSGTLILGGELLHLSQYGPFKLRYDTWGAFWGWASVGSVGAILFGCLMLVVVVVADDTATNSNSNSRGGGGFFLPFNSIKPLSRGLVASVSTLIVYGLQAAEAKHFEYTYWGHPYRLAISSWNSKYPKLNASLVLFVSLFLAVFQFAIIDTHAKDAQMKLRESYKKAMAKLPDNVQEILEQVHAKVTKECAWGEVASYIPELLTADPDKFGIALVALDGTLYTAGDVGQSATIQSVCKCALYMMARMDVGDGRVDEKIGEEPSGRAFNELAIDEQGRAYNPLINTGALVSAWLVKGRNASARYQRFQQFVRKCSYAPDRIRLDTKVFNSEMATNQNNQDLVSELIAADVIETCQDPDDPDAFGDQPGDVALEFYTMACSLSLSVVDVAAMGATLANDGVNPVSGSGPGSRNKRRVFSKSLTSHMVRVMMSCGMYNGAGKWIVDVGIPAKSGVAGFLLCVVPGVCGIGIYSPKLDENGNSARGVLVAQELSRRLNLHVLKKGCQV